MENRTLFKIVVTCGNNFKRDLILGFASESEAVDVAERYDWCLVDKNGCEYELNVEEM